MNVVFMGTPDFATGCLSSILEAGHQVSGVFTQPDRPKGRGHKLAFSPVKELALKHNLPVYQPKGFKNGEALEILKQLAPDVIVVVAYGRILPKEVLELPKYGCINVHASLLPKYRGAGPIQWAVLNGEKETGVTTMYMAEGLDTGDMIFKESLTIGEDETAGELFDRLAVLGASLIVKTLQAVEEGTAPREAQDDTQSSYAPMLTKELCAVDFHKTAKEVHNQIRGLSPWPVATTLFHGKVLKIHSSRLCEGRGTNPGMLMDHKRLMIACGDGNCIELTSVQLEGAKRVDGLSFINGQRIKAGEQFGE